MPTFPNLRALREHLSFRFEGVTRLTRLTPERLTALEGGAVPTVFETEELGRLYGVDADALADEPIKVPPKDPIHALASLDEFKVVGDTVRARIISAASACRDMVRLRNTLGMPPSVAQFEIERPSLTSTPRSLTPAVRGANIASQVRRAWGLGQQPIPSVRDLVRERLPSAEILYADLTQDGPAGLSFVDAMHGPAVVLNVTGKNENPMVRRFSLAHELCHLLVDWNKKAPLAQISGYLTDSGLDREQQANGFAVRLLCPEAVLRRLQRSTERDPVMMAREMAKYGLHYSALRLYMHNVARLELPANVPSEAVLDPSPWRARESAVGVPTFPIPKVPFERRTAIARLAGQAYSRGLISRGRFAELLGVTRAEPLERVLNLFGLDPPAENAA